MSQVKPNESTVIGWREWASLPALGIAAVKAKVDTGARTSALHAFMLESFRSEGREKIRFGIHPLQKRSEPALFCEAEVLDRRIVSDSGGHREERYVIETPLRIGEHQWSIELTLTNRDTMLFRMLLGRTAMKDRFLVDPAQSYLTGKSLRRAYARKKKQ